MHSEQLASQVQGILLLQPRTPDGGHVHSGQAVHEEKVPWQGEWGRSFFHRGVEFLRVLGSQSGVSV